MNEPEHISCPSGRNVDEAVPESQEKHQPGDVVRAELSELEQRYMKLVIAHKELVSKHDALQRKISNHKTFYDMVESPELFVANDDTILAVNGVFSERFVLSASVESTKSFSDMLKTADRSRYRSFLKEISSSGQCAQCTCTIVTNGHDRYRCRLTGIPACLGDNNDAIRILIDPLPPTDIQRHAGAHPIFRSDDQLVASVMKTARIVLLILDANGAIVRFNPYMEDMCGYRVEEVQGKDWFDLFIPPHDKPRMRQRFEDILNGGGNTSLANYIITHDGTERLIDWSTKLLKDDAGTTIGVFALGQDISERNEELKSRNLESLGILAGGIAHDFNNLLAIILGNVSLVKKHIDTSHKDYTLLANAERGINIATGLSQQLLTFAQGGAPIKKVTNVEDLIKDSALFSLKGSNVKCTFSIAQNLYPVDVDQGQMFQVLHNIVINADQAMPDGGTIRISASNITVRSKKWLPVPAGEYVKISIEDQGIGISPEHIGKVFDPYFSTKEKGSEKGVGLGLATCYSIIKKHGGYITVRSQPRIQTVFEIYLPASNQELSDDFGNDPCDEITQAARVLIMDDEPMFVDSFVRILVYCGYTVTVANDGDEAISLYQHAMKTGDPFDAVVLDLTIPGGMGGKETLAHLKVIDPSVKAIVTSGYSNDPVMSHYKSYGFEGMLTKPSSIERIRTVLASVINSEKSL